MKIKNNIKKYRARYDMTQADLAELVGIRRETVIQIEKGFNCSLLTAFRIAKVFESNIEDIFLLDESIDEPLNELKWNQLERKWSE